MTQMACCPVCGEVLVMTFERPKKEFHCVGCRNWWEFLEPVGKEETPELLERMVEVRLQFQNECRHMAHVGPCSAAEVAPGVYDPFYCKCGCDGAENYCGADLISNVMSLVGFSV